MEQCCADRDETDSDSAAEQEVEVLAGVGLPDAEECVDEECPSTDAAAISAGEPRWRSVRASCKTPDVCRPTAHNRSQDQPIAHRPSGAVAEILKLRRAVGVNPIAGTMFDVLPAQQVPCSGNNPNQADPALLSEQAIAEAIRRFETEAPAPEDTPAPLQGWRVSDEANGTELALLRPAERKLEEAAELLEQLGDYERADVARDLAFQMRQQARQLERRQRSSVVSEFITGGGVIDR